MSCHSVGQVPGAGECSELWVEDIPWALGPGCGSQARCLSPQYGLAAQVLPRLGPQNLKAAAEVADGTQAVGVCQSSHATHPRPVLISMTMSECPTGEYMENIPLGWHHSAL